MTTEQLQQQELELRFIKLMLSSTLKTLDVLHPELDTLATVRQHMLTISGGVRERALQAAPEGVAPEEATAQVDALMTMISEYFDYSASPMFPPVEPVSK